MVLRIAAIGG